MLFDRRLLLQAALAAGIAAPLHAQNYGAAPTKPADFPPIDARSVWLVGDDASRSPSDTATRLATLVGGPGKIRDSYLGDGAVEELEQAFAALLGKEACAFMPTGTLANNVALRVLCGEHPHAFCQADSHLYRDESDTAQRLSGINLVPLGSGHTAPTIADLTAAFDAAEKGPYPLTVGAISLESPVRRLDGQMIAPADLAAIAALAKAHGTRMHLDGARLLLAPPSIDTRAYAAPFDTVYVSLYKYLGAPFGAVLAGTAADIARAREWRHLYGGLIYQGWAAAVPALDSLKTFPATIARAHARADELMTALEREKLARRRSTPAPSNIHFLEMPEARAAAAFERGRAAGIRLGHWKEGAIPLYANATILRRETADYLALFRT